MAWPATHAGEKIIGQHFSRSHPLAEPEMLVPAKNAYDREEFLASSAVVARSD
jgi:hypothetical protein